MFYGEKKREIGKILRKLCEWKGVEILEAEVCPDHIHMLVSIPPKVAVSSFMGYLKGKSSVLIYEKFGELKYKYRNREFWCRGYYVDTVGKNTKAIAEYIKHFWLFILHLEKNVYGKNTGSGFGKPNGIRILSTEWLKLCLNTQRCFIVISMNAQIWLPEIDKGFQLYAEETIRQEMIMKRIYHVTEL